jgi:undecaprenyl-phosphate 4-deoxy-4-formamido-L-arabinose transferase
MKKISIIIPVYNSTKSLNELISKITKIDLDNYEIIFVDDSSKNLETRKILSNLAKKYKKIIKVILLSKNLGRTNALITGLRYATGSSNIIMDDDLQHDPKYINNFLKLKHHDVVFANYSRNKDLLNNLFSYLKYLLDRFTFENKVRISSFFMINSSIKKFLINANSINAYLPGLINESTDDIISFDIKLDKRKYGSSNYSFGSKIKIIKNIFLNYSNLPFKIIFLSGFIFLFISLFIGLKIIYNYIYFNPLPGWTSTLGLVIFFGSVNFIYSSFTGYLILKKIKNSTLNNNLLYIKKIINFK